MNDFPVLAYAYGWSPEVICALSFDEAELYFKAALDLLKNKHG